MLSTSRLLTGVPVADLEVLARASRRHRYRRQQIIFHQDDPGDSLHLIVEGRVKIALDADSGQEAVIAILGPGEFFGELSMIDGQPRSATVETLEPVETVSVARADFVRFLRSNEATAERLIVNLARMIRRADSTMADLVFLDMEGRLLKRLLELADEYGQEVDGGIEIELPVTQEDLARMVGATRASVNRVLGHWEERGAIERRGRRIVIHDAERLRRRIN